MLIRLCAAQCRGSRWPTLAVNQEHEFQQHQAPQALAPRTTAARLRAALVSAAQLRPGSPYVTIVPLVKFFVCGFAVA